MHVILVHHCQGAVVGLGLQVGPEVDKQAVDLDLRCVEEGHIVEQVDSHRACYRVAGYVDNVALGAAAFRTLAVVKINVPRHRGVVDNGQDATAVDLHLGVGDLHHLQHIEDGCRTASDRYAQRGTDLAVERHRVFECVKIVEAILKAGCHQQTGKHKKNRQFFHFFVYLSMIYTCYWIVSLF